MRHTFPEDFKCIDIGECDTIISFLVNSVEVWKASVFDHDEVHPDSLVCYSGYCLQKSFPIYSSYQRGWVETTALHPWCTVTSTRPLHIAPHPFQSQPPHLPRPSRVKRRWERLEPLLGCWPNSDLCWAFVESLRDARISHIKVHAKPGKSRGGHSRAIKTEELYARRPAYYCLF